MPLLYFGVQIQLDTMEGVAPNDTIRRVVVDVEWAYMVAKVTDLLIPFFPLTSEVSFATSVVLDVLEDAADVLKVSLMERYQVVGLLSSSFQGNASSFDALGAKRA